MKLYQRVVLHTAVYNISLINYRTADDLSLFQGDEDSNFKLFSVKCLFMIIGN